MGMERFKIHGKNLFGMGYKKNLWGKLRRRLSGIKKNLSGIERQGLESLVLRKRLWDHFQGKAENHCF
jgi:hypothetical protein